MSSPPATPPALGILETHGWTSALVALDAMEKAARVDLWQAEWNDFSGACIKLTGSIEALETALEIGQRVADQLGGQSIAQLIPNPDPAARQVIYSPDEYNPLIEQGVVKSPAPTSATPSTTLSTPQATSQERRMSDTQALGFIETQGFTAVFEAIDAACKAANVEVVGKEKLGGGYITVVIRGDVAAVKAAVEAGSARVGALGKLIAAHVIARPSSSAMNLLPASPAVVNRS
jgi:carbon dioxide concentrating mechanism protein CcmO